MTLKKFLAIIEFTLLSYVGAILGAIGGARNKTVRRVLIPLIITAVAFAKTESILVLTICSMMGVLAVGYGIPDATDEGSALGRFWYRLCRHNHLLADIFTRGTIGVLIGVSLISIPIILHNWDVYFTACLGIVVVQAGLSWRNFGSYMLFKQTLSWVETLTWGFVTAFAISLLI